MKLTAKIPIPVQQFFNQLVFLTVGKVFYRLSVTWVEIAAILVTAIFIEHALILLRERRIAAFSTAAMSTGFNLAFMLGTTSFAVYALGLLVGLGQKHFFKRTLGGHFWNPSNLAIVVGLLLFPKATYVTFADWGQTGWFALVVAVLGTLLLSRVRLVFLPFVFLAAYAAFAYALTTRNLDELLFLANSAGFLLYAFFMVTDPKTVPATKKYIVLHGVVTALLAVALQALLGEKEVNLFLALVVSEAFVPLWRRAERAPAPGRWLAPACGVLALVLAVLYFSPYNRPRNVEAAYLALNAGAAVPDATPPSAPAEAQPPARWGARDPVWYPKSWAEPKVERRPFVEPGFSGRGFRRLDAAVTPRPDGLTPADLGDETRLYAAVGAGDLDQDGDLDLVLAKARAPLRVLINDGRGRFADMGEALFDGAVPADVEQLALADMNGDSYLDVVAAHSAYFSDRGGRIYLFDPAAGRFADSGFAFGKGKHSCGGIAVADVNGDGRLDFYVSYGVNWHSASIDYQLESDTGEFYLSTGKTWRNAIERFGDVLAKQGYAGMTPLFVDIDRDGRLDFLLGNDFSDPSFVFFGAAGGGFRLAPRGLLEANTRNSMSFFQADFDNDGVGELWENGISEQFTAGRLALQKDFGQAHRSLLSRELAELERQKELGKFECAKFEHPLMPGLCTDHLLQQAAITSGDEARCSGIQAVSTKLVCRRLTRQYKESGKLHDPASFKYDVEKYPKQLRENVLLKRDAAGRYRQAIAGNDAALFTGISWAAFPFDVDHDGKLDLYVTNGMVQRSHDVNRLLLNESAAGTIRFTEQAEAWGVALEDESRGAVIADFDGDGDGDLVVNNYLGQPLVFENGTGGRAVLIDLRCHGGNFYCLGAEVSLQAGAAVMTRTVTQGGIWNTSVPATQHFGIPAEITAATLTVTWPGGRQTRVPDVKPGFKYAVFQ